MNCINCKCVKCKCAAIDLDMTKIGATKAFPAYPAATVQMGWTMNHAQLEKYRSMKSIEAMNSLMVDLESAGMLTRPKEKAMRVVLEMRKESPAIH